jgi:hypothetical protein
MIDALEKSNTRIPKYLRIVHEENSSFMKPERAVLSTSCFWRGEIELGKINGVLTTRAGFMHGNEVVEVQFNSAMISYSELLRNATRRRCAREAYVFSEEQKKSAVDLLGDENVALATTFHPDVQVKYYLSRTPYRHLPLTPMQEILINRAVFENGNPDVYLSPRQRSMLSYILRHPDIDWQRRTGDPDFRGSWNEIQEKMNKGK